MAAKELESGHAKPKEKGALLAAIVGGRDLHSLLLHDRKMTQVSYSRT